MKLNAELVRQISVSRQEPDWLTQWRLSAFAQWQKMTEPHWAEIDYEPIDYDAFDYYATQHEIDNSELEKTYEKMGLPESERRALLGMATDTIIDSQSVHTSYRDELKNWGLYSCLFPRPCANTRIW